MKRIFLIVLCVACMQFVCAQEVLTLPYEASGLTEEQKAMNPDRLAYPTELKETIKNEVSFECTPQVVELGPFSVSANKKVMFSPGNLQFNAMKGTHQCADGTTQQGTWRFAKHQYDHVGNAVDGNVYYAGEKCDNAKISSSYSGWIDLFGWATSGWNGCWGVYQPYSIDNKTTEYGCHESDIVGDYSFADWGEYNSIQNGSDIDQAGIWRTMTLDEWIYVFHDRKNADMLYGWGTIESVKGAILLPDNWTIPSELTFKPAKNRQLKWNGSCLESNSGNFYSDNIYSLIQWDKMEEAGAVFLPTTGLRFWSFSQNGTIDYVETHGDYWSSTHKEEGSAYFLCIVANAICPKDVTNRIAGQSVRLVRDIPNTFSVSANKKVMFSPGNLQFNAAKGSHACADGTSQKGTWRFAEHQWDYVGDAENGTVYENGTKCDNTKVNATYTGWIDLFGWGTSGWSSGANAYKPYETSQSGGDYSPDGYENTDLTGTYAYADWGMYNQIGDAPPGTWRTLTNDEWLYLFRGRMDAEKLFGLGTVNGVPGIILLPDEWITPSDVTFTPSTAKGLVWEDGYYTNSNKDNYSHNTYTAAQWNKMESGGAVFLPAAGVRDGTTVLDVSTIGYYWSSTHFSSNNAYDLSFYTNGLGLQYDDRRNNGFAVRLVSDVK